MSEWVGEPERIQSAKARHCGTTPLSCSLLAVAVAIIAYSLVSHTRIVPSTDAVAKRSQSFGGNATSTIALVWLSDIIIYFIVAIFILAMVPLAVEANISKLSGLNDIPSTGLSNCTWPINCEFKSNIFMVQSPHPIMTALSFANIESNPFLVACTWMSE